MTDEKRKTHIMTPVTTMSHPKLVEKAEDASGNLCFSVQVLFDPKNKPFTENLMVCMNNAAWNKWGLADYKKCNAVHFIADGKEDDEIQMGMKRFSAKEFKTRPKLFLPDMTPVSEKQIETYFYAGAKVRILVSAYGTDKGKKNTIAFGLDGVMFIEHGDRLGSGIDAAEHFNEIADKNWTSTDESPPDWMGEQGNSGDDDGDFSF